MAEIKEPRSAFAAHEKAVVQEWLDHPCTVSLIEQIDRAVAESKGVLVDFVTNMPIGLEPTFVAAQARNAGSIIATFKSVRELFAEAQRYANS